MKTFDGVIVALAAFLPIAAESAITQAQLDGAADKVDGKVIEWRRDIHQHPELSNREVRTSAKVAEHLKRLGLEVRTGIAHTGVTAVLRGGKPGPTVALRADMDALPVVEQVDVPFKSTVKAQYLGKEVGVMHACGHDAHTAVLMGVAEVLTSLRKELPGTVLFVFQPAEEGPPEGEEGGAPLMIKEGLFAQIKPDAMFGLHVAGQTKSGEIGYRSGPSMAASDGFQIEVTGVQTHGARPWAGVDPIVTASQIVMGLQTIVSRQVDITKLPAVITVGKFDSGVRYNIVPETAQLRGTLRTYDPKIREDIIARMHRTVENIAAANGAKAKLTMIPPSNPVLFNDPALTERSMESLRRLVGADRMRVLQLATEGEDFAFYGAHVPTFFFRVGITPPDVDPATAPANHSQLLYIHEPALAVATRAMLAVAVDFLQNKK